MSRKQYRAGATGQHPPHPAPRGRPARSPGGHGRRAKTAAAPGKLRAAALKGRAPGLDSVPALPARQHGEASLNVQLVAPRYVKRLCSHGRRAAKRPGSVSTVFRNGHRWCWVNGRVAPPRAQTAGTLPPARAGQSLRLRAGGLTAARTAVPLSRPRLTLYSDTHVCAVPQQAILRYQPGSCSLTHPDPAVDYLEPSSDPAGPGLRTPGLPLPEIPPWGKPRLSLCL